jgi:hypothetical protein
MSTQIPTVANDYPVCAAISTALTTTRSQCAGPIYVARFYCQRFRIENMHGRLQDWRGTRTLYDRTADAPCWPSVTPLFSSFCDQWIPSFGRERSWRVVDRLALGEGVWSKVFLKGRADFVVVCVSRMECMRRSNSDGRGDALDAVAVGGGLIELGLTAGLSR